MFPGPRLVVFCDGDFWHGKEWKKRRAKLASGSNASYWVAKIERNRERDRTNTALLEADGWTVLRYWESAIHEDTTVIAEEILRTLSTQTGQNLTLDRNRRKKGVNG